ncbi:ADP-ribose pyrophosphatase YjhB, NUDIX family [Marininema mesophilum]|uniref:ADP-ribose pyrophosphatase YjhB, NUDIX family n=1 Tax=Marininema mesophilum TaxID=1048340 RepID=A0A1H2UMJ9_9BACL|nr:NUDIX hydrolase [Marininema mesophilum]SDW57341.1 ADP-ribose pyrophosphatase YjhB, NUDIX family [Marininema mesophilum]
MGYVSELRKMIGHRPVILVGSVVILMDKEKGILLQQRKEPKGLWGLPGGLMELGESAENTATRELYEETGLLVDNLTLVGVFSGEEYFVKLQNGDEFYAVTIVYTSQDFEGELLVSDKESLDLRFFQLDTIPENMMGSSKKILNNVMKNGKLMRR